jgi:hypothetical protein
LKTDIRGIIGEYLIAGRSRRGQGRRSGVLFLADQLIEGAGILSPE